MSLELWRRRYRKAPVTAVKREIVSAAPEFDSADELPPVLCVTGDPRGAAAFAEHWLPHIAARGRAVHAVSVRGQGKTPKGDGGRAGRVHDLVQAAVRLPRRAVLVGHGSGAQLVAHALTRYPAAAGVLLAPQGVRSAPGDPVGGPRLLVAGSPEDRKSPQKTLDKAAAAYHVAPLLFPGISHDFMSDPGWKAPLDAILDWLDEKDE
ncbi:MAG: alpha/beta hydrolase [Stackebrandtia sp.]